ncbi:MAG: 16S rRNA (cytosine(1402)-N(4))-methyltransferase RsmH [Candidatus Paceibacterota bacterium]
MKHKPVLLNEVINTLSPSKGQTFIDGTLGAGGHAKEIIRKISPGGTFLGIDKDPDNLRETKEFLEKVSKEENLDLNLNFKVGDYKDIKDFLNEKKLPKVDGLILDLGFSSNQLESGKGFSFQKDEPLIMRYDDNLEKVNAFFVLNNFDKGALIRIFSDFGEEKYASKIAEEIIKTRKNKAIKTTFELSNLIKKSVPNKKSKIHPATRVFMALRIFINDEFGSLKDLLEDLTSFMANDSKVAIISFHSLEDRIVKNYFKKIVKNGKAEFIEKLIRPTEEEISNNPRSRSAKLRSIKIKK